MSNSRLSGFLREEVQYRVMATPCTYIDVYNVHVIRLKSNRGGHYCSQFDAEMCGCILYSLSISASYISNLDTVL